MKKTGIVSLAFAGGVIFAPSAYAATGYTNGIGGIGVDWTTITGSNGEKITGSDQRIKPKNAYSVDSYKEAQRAWLLAHPDEDNTLWTFSESSQSVIELMNENPELFTRTKVIILAPPKEGSIRYSDVVSPNAIVAEKIIVRGDSVADSSTGRKSLNTHLTGYNGLNMQTQQPISSNTIPGTNTSVKLYDKPSGTGKFNLFDMRTWFKPKATVQKEETVVNSLNSPKGMREFGDHPPKKPSARAERRAQEKTEQRKARQGARAERRAQRSSEHS